MASTDPLGLTQDPAANDPSSPDYLGRLVPLAFKGQPALPVTGAAAVGSPSGPVTTPGGTGGESTGGGGAVQGRPPGGFLDLAVRLLDKGIDITKSLPGGVVDLGTRGETGGISLSDYLRSSGLGEFSTGETSVFGAAEALGATAADLQALGATGAEIGTGAAAGGASAAGSAAGDAAGGVGAGLAEGIGEALPFVGAAVPLITSFASGGPKTATDAANLGVQTAAAIAAPFTFGASEAAVGIAQGIEDILAGAPLDKTILDFGGLGMLYNLFEHQGPYVPKRKAAAGEAVSELSALGTSLQDAAKAFATSGSPADALKGLQTQFGERNPVRTDIFVPKDIATKLGLSGPRDWGDRFQLSWSEITPEQFPALLQYMSGLPDQGASMLIGSGDVAYLPQEQAQQVADRAVSDTQTFLAFLMGGAAGAQQGVPADTPPFVQQAMGGTFADLSQQAMSSGGGGEMAADEVLTGAA
jgi:hypothetical protein